MASHHGNCHSEPSNKMEQIITEFFAKSLHIILESRRPFVVSSRNYCYSDEQALSSPSPSRSSSSSSSSFRHRDKLFNLALGDCPPENMDFLRQSSANLEPMIVDVILIQRNCEPSFCYSEVSCVNEWIIERWVVQYESKKGGGGSGGPSPRRSSCCMSSHSLYKKSILLLRSLYATVRLLPAYKLFRDLHSSSQIPSHNLVHRVSSFVEPFTRREEADMQRFAFAPIETSSGRLCLSVLYRSAALLDRVRNSSEPSTPISPQFISEYVGSPLAEPLKRFPSQPSPSTSPFGRRHSWSYDLYRTSQPSLNPSPSPTYSDSRASISKRLPPAALPPPRLHEDTPAAVHLKNPSYDEYWPSPTFSPSPSPSPPTHVSGNLTSNALLRSESAPVSIPVSRLSSVPSLPSNQMKAGPPTSSKQDAPAGLYRTSSKVDKLFHFYRDDPGKMSSAKPSLDSSPSKSFSRSSSRLSFQDDYDDTEFSGPFVVDDEDMVDRGSRPSSFDQPRHPSAPEEPGGVFLVKRSQDAAVGALVCMLKKAPPLRQDTPATADVLGFKHETLKNCRKNSYELSEEAGVEQSASKLKSLGLFSWKTTSDALEELQVYKEMKDLLLKQGKISRP